MRLLLLMMLFRILLRFAVVGVVGGGGIGKEN
jgi:hypothetical protein